MAHGLAASVNGQDPRSNVYLLDGTLMNDFTNSPAGSAAGTTLGTETVREFRVETNAYGAEFGRNSGGQINVITKSGTNDFHGSVYEFHRNDALDARNFFDPDAEARLPAQPVRRSPLGGPVRRDRTFFFVGYEGLRERLGRTISDRGPERGGAGRRPARRPGAGRSSVPVSPSVRPYLDEFPLPNGEELGRRPRRLQLPVHADDRPGLLPGPARPEPRRRTTSSSSATPTTGPSSTCPPTFPSSRGRSSRGTSS